MAGGRRRSPGGSKKGGGSAGGGTPSGDKGGPAPVEEADNGTPEGEESSGEPDGADNSGGPDGGDDADSGEPEVCGGDTDTPEKAKHYHLIHEDLNTEGFFTVTTRESIGDIGRVVSELPESVAVNALLVYGSIIDFSVKQRKVFHCGEDEVEL